MSVVYLPVHLQPCYAFKTYRVFRKRVLYQQPWHGFLQRPFGEMWRYQHCLKNAPDLEIRNPCNHISKLPVDRKVKFIPTEEMIEKVIEKYSPAQKQLVRFAYETAARINECISLKYNDVPEKHVVLYSRKSENSTSVPRSVPRPDFIELDGKGKVFKEWDAYPRFLEKKIKELKHPRWNWHSLRHRRASIWANSDIPLFQLQMLLGHSQISTTQRYLHSLGIVKL